MERVFLNCYNLYMEKEQEMIGVGIIVLNDKNQILMGERKNAYGAGLFGMPGGRIELKEPLVKAVKRELLEETGLIVKSCEYIGVARELQKGGNFIHFGFVVKNIYGVPQNLEPDKCIKWEWFNLDEVPGQMLPGHKATLDMYLNPKTPRYRDVV